jgi:hypothetical protein
MSTLKFSGRGFDNLLEVLIHLSQVAAQPAVARTLALELYCDDYQEFKALREHVRTNEEGGRRERCCCAVRA